MKLTEYQVINKLREEARKQRHMDYIQRENELKRRLRADYMRAAKRLNDLVDIERRTKCDLIFRSTIPILPTRDFKLFESSVPTRLDKVSSQRL